MKIQLSDHSKQSLRDIVDYHSSISMRKTGMKLRAKILNKIMKLKEFPSIGQFEEHFKDMEIEHRYLVEGHYKVIYCQIKDTILITDIFDTRQDPEKMVGA